MQMTDTTPVPSMYQYASDSLQRLHRVDERASASDCIQYRAQEAQKMALLARRHQNTATHYESIATRGSHLLPLDWLGVRLDAIATWTPEDWLALSAHHRQHAEIYAALAKRHSVDTSLLLRRQMGRQNWPNRSKARTCRKETKAKQ